MFSTNLDYVYKLSDIHQKLKLHQVALSLFFETCK